MQVLIGSAENEEDTLLVKANITIPLPSQLVQKSTHTDIVPLRLADHRYWKPNLIDMLVGAVNIPNF